MKNRKEWLLEKTPAKLHQNLLMLKKHQFWRHDNKPIELWSNKVIKEKIQYIHQNPVAKGLVCFPEDYKYSSAKDYAGEIGLINDVIVLSL